MQQKKVVCLGGGTGLSTLLRGLKKYCHPTAIVTMADSGGHSGRLRDELGVLPPGDVRSCLVALADEKKASLVRDLFNYRFENGSQQGTNVGNLLLAALNDILGDFNKAVAAAHELLGLKGRVVPVTLEPVDLLAELEDGTILFGEKAIDLPRKNGYLRIKRVWLQPRATANPVAVQAIREADAIVLGPGDLYTSILPNLYINGIREAIHASTAPLLYVSNIMTKHGETDGFAVEDFVAVLNGELPRPIDSVLYNSELVPSAIAARYEPEKAAPVLLREKHPDWLGEAVLSTAGDLARHDSDKLGRAVADLIKMKASKETYARVA